MTRGVFVLLPLVLTSPAVAQTRTLVVPAGFAAKFGGWLEAAPVLDPNALPGRTQLGYASADFPARAYFLKSLAFRLALTSLVSTSVRWNVTLSSSPRRPSEYARTFTTNSGKDARLVFGGWTNLKSKTGFGTKIPFAKPFLFIPGNAKSLCVDIVTLARKEKPPWFVDAAHSYPRLGTPPFARKNFFSTTCRDSSGRFVSQMGGSSQLWIGGFFSPIFYPAPPYSLGVEAIGLRGVGGSFAGKKLPFVIPGAPGCFWAIEPLLFWSYVIDGQGWARVPPFDIPYDRRLAGSWFYDQPVFFDPKANAAGLVSGPSMRWPIRPAIHTVSVERSKSFPSLKAEGYMVRGKALVMRFEY